MSIKVTSFSPLDKSKSKPDEIYICKVQLSLQKQFLTFHIQFLEVITERGELHIAFPPKHLFYLMAFSK